jgi:adenine deaminase
LIIQSNFVDIRNRRIFPAKISVENGVIVSISETAVPLNTYILPGFIDAHVHIESSLLVPSEFARMAVTHGTVATVSDPHEIANVCGMEGVNFMLHNAAKVPFHFFFGAPSCVPATIFETAGASLRAVEVESLLRRNDIWYLSEMMNFPGVLHKDPEVMKKIRSAIELGKPVDGHAPGLGGNDAANYFGAGITTDHECFSLREAQEKLALGVKIIVREGSAARNFDELIPLIAEHAANMMFCSDDKHPDNLLEGHINKLVARAVDSGYDLFRVLQAACINPVLHYGLPVGTMQVGDAADFIVVKDLQQFLVESTWIGGKCVYEKGESLIAREEPGSVNRFDCEPLMPQMLAKEWKGAVPVIECLDGQLITNRVDLDASQVRPENDILKLVVVNRYHKAPPAIACVKNFGLRKGAIASSVAHDSHNIIAVGVNDEELCAAVNLVIREQGGLSATAGREPGKVQHVLPLPVAGLMSTGDAWEVAEAYTRLHRFAIDELGSSLKAPFMSLSFMALLVIPHLKLSDKGLFDGDEFRFV